MIPRLREARREDSGVTLVELLVYCIILVGIMAIAATLFITVLTKQRDIRDIANANNQAQLVFRQLEQDVRNASWVKIQDGGNVMVLRTRVAQAGNFTNAYCVAYYVDAADAELRRDASTTNLETAAILAATTASQRKTVSSDWGRALDGFSAISSVRVFGQADGVVDLSKTVTLNMQVTTNNGSSPIKFSKNVSLRTQKDLGTAGCS